MMCYDEKGGSFPFTYEEIELMQQVLSEKIRDMENNVDAKDPHKYRKIRSLYGKTSGLVWIVDTTPKRNICCYKGFKTEIKYSRADNCYYGKLEGIRDLVNFEGESREEALKNFQVAVDDYLEMAKEVKE